MNNKSLRVTLLFVFFACYNTTQAMELNSELYHEKSAMSFLMRAIEEKHIKDQKELDSDSEEELKIIEQKNSNIKTVNNYVCSRKNCIFVCSHEKRIIKHREMHRLEDTSPHIKMYRCDICGYMSHVKRCIDDHNKSHDDKKQYHCDICDVSFKSARSRNRHNATSLMHKQNSQHRLCLEYINS